MSSNSKRKVCVVVGSRANYSSIKSAMRAVRDHADLTLQLVVGASALLDRYGTVVDVIERDGFEPDEKVFMLIEGETPGTMAKSTGLGLLELPTAFDRLEPDVVITVGEHQSSETVQAVKELALPAMMLWPNADAGSEDIARGIRKFREHDDDSRLHFFKNLPTDDYIKLMGKTACLVGNSSSAIREGSFAGTPAVNVGTRQKGRERGSNVIDVGYDRHEIVGAVRRQLEQ